MKNIVLEGEQMYQQLKEINKVKTDSTNWLVYYKDKLNNEKWVEEYPNSEYQGGGGGAPQLRKIEQFPWDE